MNKGHVTHNINNGIATITFGTPKSNALPGEILEELAQTIMDCGKDSSTKAILLKSDGERAFCAGASFDELLEIDELETSKNFFGGFAKVLNAMRTCGKVIVVRVQGKTTGGGVGIACAADYCFATQEASLALTELNLGIGPFVIGPYVERKVGKAEFIALTLDTEFRSAEWAKANHIYNVVSKDINSMDAEIATFLEKLSSRSSEALSLVKNIAWENTEDFDAITPERIEMSARLILEETAKASIEKIKQRLRNK